MQFHFFTVPAQFPEENQQELNGFCAQHRVLAIEKHFVNLGAGSYWSICVSTIEGNSQHLLKAGQSKRTSIDYKEILSESEFLVYAQLRDLRKAVAKQDGIPVYAVFTNEQLAEMITRRVTSQTEMAQIDGIGKARLEKYGRTFLTLLQSLQSVRGDDENHLAADETPPN